MREFYQALNQYLAQGQSVCLVTHQAGGRIHKELYPAGADGPYAALVAQAQEMGQPLLIHRQEGLILAEPFVPQARLIILGGGHISLPLAQMADLVGFEVVVVDDRPSFANAPRFPWAARVICDGFANAIRQLQINSYDYVVIVTRGHRHDSLCLQQLCQGQPPAYLGMIGSRRRVAAVKQLLTEEGVPAQRLSRLHAPIGLPIGAETPAEIAASILAELIQCKRALTLNGIPLSGLEQQVFTQLAAQETAAVLLTVAGAQGSTPRGLGAKLLLDDTGQSFGSIGGGCAEAAVMAQARELLGQGVLKLVDIDPAGSAYQDDMVCGGRLQVLLEDTKGARYRIMTTAGNSGYESINSKGA